MQGCEDKMSYCQVNSSLPGCCSPRFTQISVSGPECHRANAEGRHRVALGKQWL